MKGGPAEHLGGFDNDTGLQVLGHLNCSAQGREMDGPERGTQSWESQERLGSAKGPTMMA